MEKKYIVMVVVVIALWAAFMGFRHLKKKESTQANRADNYKRLVEMSKKSPRAGLPQMAKALNRYYQDNKAYPSSLTDLYPKYISSSAFISEVDWNYEPGPDDFSLSKTVVYKKREMTASIDKDLRPQVETGGVMVAGGQRVVRRPPRDKEEAPEELDVPEEVAPELEIVDEVQMTGQEATVVVAAAGSMLERADFPTSSAIDVQREMAKIVARVGPRVRTEGPAVRTEVDEGEKSELSLNLERYLVWKDKDGVIGIGNIQYPQAEDMYVAVQDRWYIVKRRPSDAQATSSATPGTTGPVEEDRGIDQMAVELSGNYLVWKNENGAVGIGNVQYPDRGPLTIASRDEWRPFKRASFSQEEKRVVNEKTDTAVDTDRLASDLTPRYLVWKDKNGVIGIGNVQYPDQGPLTIASRDEWRPFKRASFSQEEKRVVNEKTDPELDTDRLASDLTPRYLVWKDKNGVIGVGNVEYPDKERLAIASFDKWDTRKDEPLPQVQETVADEQKASGAINPGISNKYLMWKDKNGVVGYGNVQYPESISHIHSGQNWERTID